MNERNLRPIEVRSHRRFRSRSPYDKRSSYIDARDDPDQKVFSSDLTDSTTSTLYKYDNHEIQSTPAGLKKAIWKEIWIPLFLIIFPMLLVPTLFIAVIARYRVQHLEGLYLAPTGSYYFHQKAWLLLNLPVTWLTWVSSRGSQIGSMLSGPLMTLWTWRSASTLVQASSTMSESGLPTPYQYSLLIGVCLASWDQLWKYSVYKWSTCRNKLSSPPVVLRRSAVVLLWVMSLGGLMLAADTLFHYTSDTVELENALVSTNVSAFGRGLSQQCLLLNRTENNGFPCSLNSFLTESEFVQGQNEGFLLYNNESDYSEVQIFPKHVTTIGDVAVLLPRIQRVPRNVDFRASTIGISTKCQSITNLCGFRAWGPDDGYSSFYCSPEFWGSLGDEVNSTSTETSAERQWPPLVFRIGTYMLLGFFAGKNLTIPYNTVGYDPNTGFANLDMPLSAMWPDDKLINQVQFAVAARFPPSLSKAREQLSMDQGFFSSGPSAFLDVVLGCSYEAYHVDYTWFNGSVHDTIFTPAPNGTISEIWHGRHVPDSLTGNDPAYLRILEKASRESSSAASFSHIWENEYSSTVMAKIGGFLSGRSNHSQQSRAPMLLARLWIPALVFVLVCCLAYVGTAIVLGMMAFHTGIQHDVRDAVARLSIFGVTDWASRESERIDAASLLREKRPGEETLRIRFVGNSDGGFNMRSYSPPSCREIV